MRLVRQWVRLQRQRFEARRWIKANGPRVAAEAMFHLNRQARQRVTCTQLIYELKNKLVQSLYEQGYCVTASIQQQRLPCWSCDGTGEYWTGEECWKCDGTGVYASHQLYLFVFEVSGRRYVWHQPARWVDWPVELTDELPGEYRQSSGMNGYLAAEVRDLYIVTVYEYLRVQKAGDLPSLPSLRTAMRKDWYHSRWRQLWLQWRWRKRARRRNVLALDEDEIPF
ncbi:MAG: hypothetical protein FOGNACKC_02255 [Anaerolineae bacterium]|nr:hypothetical protein [Anaerolineae bacterium]